MRRGIGAALASGMLALVGVGCDREASVDGYGEKSGTGDFTYTAAEVTGIEIDWSDGTIEIEQSSAPTLRVVEEGRVKSEEEERLQYSFEGSVLKIGYRRSGRRGGVSPSHKHLCVEIPKGIDLDIDNVAADIVVGVLYVNELSLSTRTGAVTAEKWTCRSVSVETDSADVSVGELIASSLDVESKSGKLKFGLSEEITGEIESGSGDVTLSLLKDLGASLHFQTKSGAFLTEKEHTRQGNRYDIVGADADKVCRLAVETGSGSLTVK